MNDLSPVAAYKVCRWAVAVLHGGDVEQHCRFKLGCECETSCILERVELLTDLVKLVDIDDQ